MVARLQGSMIGDLFEMVQSEYKYQAFVDQLTLLVRQHEASCSLSRM